MRQWRIVGVAVVFYETNLFTEQIVDLIDDRTYALLQAALVADPEAGDLIPRSRGLRKIRWSATGRGKRGGIRVIYYLVCRDEIFMLYAYSKTEREDMTNEQTRVLRELVEQHLKT